ncbi:hypothetical protein Y032_0538g3141 [Ancylostoma ceylanicum]|uniref:Uncharacterized protein n=1 Tax=Ancylostoma ceylanicum TaxID=53326 RepID=A0A016WR05_9BILA|nr:hypothetical protein Y032_0538g3141 [Ancylostoma ceylanicum]
MKLTQFTDTTSRKCKRVTFVIKKRLPICEDTPVNMANLPLICASDDNDSLRKFGHFSPWIHGFSFCFLCHTQISSLKPPWVLHSRHMLTFCSLAKVVFARVWVRLFDKN